MVTVKPAKAYSARFRNVRFTLRHRVEGELEMLGSRFDLSEVLVDLSAREEPNNEASCLELERDIAAMAQTVHTARTRISFRCPVCDDAMRLRDERALSEFDGLDVKLHRLECDTCGMLTGRVYHPTVGYHTNLVR